MGHVTVRCALMVVETRNTAQKNADALLVMSKEFRLEANVERTGILQDRITARRWGMSTPKMWG